MPISIDAMSIHHIANKIVRGRPSFRGSDTHTHRQNLVAGGKNVIVAHSGRFGVDMLNREGIPPPRVVCTLKLARHLDTNGVIPNCNFQYLRYFLDLEIEATPHTALGDVLVFKGCLVE